MIEQTTTKSYITPYRSLYCHLVICPHIVFLFTDHTMHIHSLTPKNEKKTPSHVILFAIPVIFPHSSSFDVEDNPAYFIFFPMFKNMCLFGSCLILQQLNLGSTAHNTLRRKNHCHN